MSDGISDVCSSDLQHAINGQGIAAAHLSIVQVRRRNTLTVYGVLLACSLPFLSSTWTGESWVHLGVEWLGLGLILLAIAGRCWCILYLGGHKGAELIDQGPYSDRKRTRLNSSH